MSVFTQVAIELGLDAILVKPKRQIGDFVAQVTIREEHHDVMEITQQPVERGAAITDHAFKKPAELVIEAGWSNTPSSNLLGSSSSVLGSLAGAVTGTIGGISDLLGQLTSSDVQGAGQTQVNAMYQKFLELQASAIPFDVYTGKRVYNDMLIADMRAVTDKQTENCLLLTIRFQQVLIVSTATTAGQSIDPASQTQPQDTAPTVDAGEAQLAPAGSYNQSAGDATIALDA